MDLFPDNLKSVVNQYGLETGNFDTLLNSAVNLFSLLLVLPRNETLFRPKLTFNQTYDYIIVGAGAAVSVVASRLTEKPCKTVLLLEAGGEPPILTDVPALARFFYESPIDWKFKTTPQKYSGFGYKEKRITLNNGKVVGGSTVMNGMQVVRGNKKNYDDWEADGATGWSYEDVLPYFKKLEDNHNMDEVDAEYHGVGGPVAFEKINYTAEIKQPIIKALIDMGYKVRDSNGRQQAGIYDLQMTANNQKRCSATKAYLDPVRQRPNLDILTNAYARKVLIRRRNGVNRAYGVEFDFDGKTRRVRARKEVILANGAIKTPQILILSGIGPREHLEKLNIKVVSDLPVGKNLMDHQGSAQLYTVSEKLKEVTFKVLNPLNVLDYVVNRKGPLCAPTQIALLAFLNSTDDAADFPQHEFSFGEYSMIDAKLHMNLKDEVFDAVFRPYLLRPCFLCSSAALQPHSRGELSLNSTDPYDDPLIDTRYFMDERDLKTVVEGLKVCNKIARHPALKKIKAEPLKTVVPGCEPFVGDEDKYLTCFARHLPLTTWHYAGTAKMGQKNDPRSVVDPQLRVIGVDGLRVVNAAVMPILPSGNTMIPVLMVAEKASDMIKEDISC